MYMYTYSYLYILFKILISVSIYAFLYVSIYVLFVCICCMYILYIYVVCIFYANPLYACIIRILTFLLALLLYFFLTYSYLYTYLYMYMFYIDGYVSLVCIHSMYLLCVTVYVSLCLLFICIFSIDTHIKYICMCIPSSVRMCLSVQLSVYLYVLFIR
jgi:hypothetical protein